MTDEKDYIELENEPADPLAREQVVNRTREFGDPEDAPVLSPWAKEAAPAAQPAGAQEPAAQAVDPYARPNRYGQNAEPRTDAPVYGTAPRREMPGREGGSSYGAYTYAQQAQGAAQGASAAEPVQKAPKKKREARYVSLRGFIAGLLCCALATSGITLGALGIGGVFSKTPSGGSDGKVVSATNYTLAEATGNEKSIEEIVAMNENAVVEIMTESVVTDSWLQSYVTQGAGSGIIVDSRGYIVTNNHVISGARSITVTLKTGEQFSAFVVGADPDNDVAVIKIEGSGFVAATYGDSDGLSVGDLAVAIGNPLGQLGGTVTTGIISALDRELTIDGKVLTLLQTDASINPGNSGGGLFDGEGNLIGLVVAKSGGSNVEGLGFAIPINKVAPIVKDMIENGNTEARALIGINILNIETEDDAKTYGFESTGLFITEVTSPEARKAGLEAGDRIIGVDGAEISDYDVLTEALGKHAPGDKVTVTVLRDGKTVEIKTTLIAG
ncbi:MAG: trypsin-like peptidase domain-containing protein [Clostridia bacterium]|nr:trypsin-like peptidase domain-containing protein [Clostridia bacterium]